MKQFLISLRLRFLSRVEHEQATPARAIWRKTVTRDYDTCDLTMLHFTRLRLEHAMENRLMELAANHNLRPSEMHNLFETQFQTDIKYTYYLGVFYRRHIEVTAMIVRRKTAAKTPVHP